MPKGRRADTAKRSPSKPKYAHGCVLKPGETTAPDLRCIHLNERDRVYVRTALPLEPGCSVLMYGKSGPSLGIYSPGPPARIAEYVNPWTTDKVRKGRPISNLASMAYLVSIERDWAPR